MELGGLVLLGLAALGVLGILVAVTWLTFPAAAVLRTLGRPDPARFVRQALGPGAVVRDLGDVFEAEVTRGPQRIRVIWSQEHTRIQVRGHAQPPADPTTRTEAREQLTRLGELHGTAPLEWEAFRPPDPQLARAVRAAMIATGR